MKTTAMHRLVVSFVGRALSLLGFAGMVSVPTQANANLERERASLEKRMQSARAVLRETLPDPVIETREKAGIDHVAQQRKRGNWNNWPNWNNWANWFNR